MEQALAEFTDELKRSFGDHLRSVILYGSGASGGTHAGSDLNLIVVLDHFSLGQIDGVRKALARFERSSRIFPVFWAERELLSARDVFPAEFLDLKENYRVLHGADPAAGLSPDLGNLRHQVEFELRSKILRMRSEWVRIKGSKALIGAFLSQAGPSFLALFKHARACCGKLDDSLAEPFRECVRLKRKEKTAGLKDLETLYRSVHEAACRTAEEVDASEGERK